jgi:hypothetical protein
VIPEPTNKLDAAAALVGVVSGSEGEIFDWGQIDWRQVEDHVRRLRHRIFTADLHGVEGGGPPKGSPVAEVDAPIAREHAA